MTEKISHRKIAIKTLLSILVMAVIITVINCWPQIMQAFEGDVLPISQWPLKPRSLIFLIGMGAYFYYRDWARQKEAIKLQQEVEAKHQKWIDAE